jgi:uncharacterized membrane protein
VIRQAGQVAFGPERTIEQDSMFAFRVIVNIAIKALSPAINDPTTVVIAIDQLQHLLRDVGWRYLRDDTILDATGQPRLILRTPNWDFAGSTTFPLAAPRCDLAEIFQFVAVRSCWH